MGVKVETAQPSRSSAHLGGLWGMADHLIRLLAIPDAVLLLMEKGEACRDVTGHQVRVLEGELQGLP